jgi:hypothetical protein
MLLRTVLGRVSDGDLFHTAHKEDSLSLACLAATAREEM